MYKANTQHLKKMSSGIDGAKLTKNLNLYLSRHSFDLLNIRLLFPLNCLSDIFQQKRRAAYETK